MPKDEMVYADHMLDKAHEALSLVRGRTRQDYNDDLALRLALTHLIQIIGEAATPDRHLSCPLLRSISFDDTHSNLTVAPERATSIRTGLWECRSGNLPGRWESVLHHASRGNLLLPPPARHDPALASRAMQVGSHS